MTTPAPRFTLTYDTEPMDDGTPNREPFALERDGLPCFIFTDQGHAARALVLASRIQYAEMDGAAVAYIDTPNGHIIVATTRTRPDNLPSAVAEYATVVTASDQDAYSTILSVSDMAGVELSPALQAA